MKVVYFLLAITFLAISSDNACGQRGERLRKIIESRRDQGRPSTNAIEKEIDVNGVKRSYVIHLPPRYRKGNSLPLVLAFHGGGGNAENMMKMTGFDQKADSENFIAVYPNGSGKLDDMLLTWNALGCCAYAMDNKVDDVAFISQLLDQLEKEYSIDKSRIYLTGFSNGAMISHLLASKLSDRIAAAAPVSGSIFKDTPQPVGKVSILMIHGTADTAVPYDGGNSPRHVVNSNQSAPYSPVSDGAAFWAKNDRCSATPIKTESGNIKRERFTACAGGTDVEVISIKGGNHSWPGGQKGREAADAPSSDLNATDEIWDFFKRHHK